MTANENVRNVAKAIGAKTGDRKTGDKVLLVGSGGREHALAVKLLESPEIAELIVAPGNAGIALLPRCRCVSVKATDLNGLLELARNERVDFALVAPDDPLAMGAVDRLEAAGVPCFGPTKAAARIESSKAYAKELMRRHGIPTAAFAVFERMDEALAYLDHQEAPIVVKADGLALGKGVRVCGTIAEAREAVKQIMQEHIFGASGNKLVIEACLEGPEVSVLAFTDGRDFVALPASMDHKRACDGDEGPNTGGMGVVAPNPYYTAEIAEQCRREIFEPTLRALREDGAPFKGCLYFGLMLTAKGPYVIEYNCRFGDPEAQAVLPFLDTDLYRIIRAVRDGHLGECPVAFHDGASCCLILASAGYPKPYEKGFPIRVCGKPDARLDWAGVAAAAPDAVDSAAEAPLRTAGGRVLGVTALAPTLKEAIAKAYAEQEKVRFANKYYRRDIGRKALEALFRQ